MLIVWNRLIFRYQSSTSFNLFKGHVLKISISDKIVTKLLQNNFLTHKLLGVYNIFLFTFHSRKQKSSVMKMQTQQINTRSYTFSLIIFRYK